MITISLINPPAGASKWVPTVYVGSNYLSPGKLSLSETWEVEVSGTIDFRVILFDSAGKYIALHDLYDISAEEGHEYTYNWSGNSWKDVTGGGPPAGPPVLAWIIGGGILAVIVVYKLVRRGK